MKNDNSNPRRIIVIQVGGFAFTGDLFDAFGIRMNEHYLLFEQYDSQVRDAVTPRFPQLVFTSYAWGIDAPKVSEDIKGINPSAIVLALTSNPVPHDPYRWLDGVIDKMVIARTSIEHPSKIAKRFLELADANHPVELTRGEISRMVRELQWRPEHITR